MGAPRVPRPADPRRGGRHDPHRLPQQPNPVQHAPHGVFYNKDSEGAPYADSTSGADKADDGVPPAGRTCTCGRCRSAPGPGHGRSQLGDVDVPLARATKTADINTGLMGPMIVTAPGRRSRTGRPRTWTGRSWSRSPRWTRRTAATSCTTFGIRWHAGPWRWTRSSARRRCGASRQFYFTESMNGFLYGNGPMHTMHKGERVRWYLMATPLRDAHAALARQRRRDRPHADGRASLIADGDGDRRHGPRQPGRVAVPLPSRPTCRWACRRGTPC